MCFKSPFTLKSIAKCCELQKRVLKHLETHNSHVHLQELLEKKMNGHCIIDIFHRHIRRNTNLTQNHFRSAKKITVWEHPGLQDLRYTTGRKCRFFSTENVKTVGTDTILARTENAIDLAPLPVLESHLHALKNFPAEEQCLFSTRHTRCQNLLPLCRHRRRCWVLLCGSEVFEGKVPRYWACSQSAVHTKASTEQFCFT